MQTLRQKITVWLMKIKLAVLPPSHRDRQSMDWRSWQRRFADRSQRPDPACEHEPLGLAKSAHKQLLRSLAIFQLGEGGEGRIAHQIDHATIVGIDNHYRQALKYFVAEEGRHARLLGRCIQAQGGRLLTENWTEKLFVFGRRLIGIRLKLMVLLVAEVVGVTAYRLIAARLPDGYLGQTLHHICDDEMVHLDFHCQFFRTQTATPMKRIGFLAVWWAIATGALIVVLLDHRKCLTALSISKREFMRRAVAAIRESGRLSLGKTTFPSVQAALQLHG